MRTLTAPFLALVLLSGCAAPIQATRDLPQPQSLAEVNALLDGKRVTIELATGERIEYARDAEVLPARVRYTLPAPGPTPGRVTRFTPIAEVERITYVRNRGARPGAIVGAAPGVAMMGFGAGLFLAAGATDYPVGAVLGGVLLGATGGVLTLIGAPLGGAVGSAVSPGGIVPLYEAPVERYLSQSPPAPAPVSGE